MDKINLTRSCAAGKKKGNLWLEIAVGYPMFMAMLNRTYDLSE